MAGTRPAPDLDRMVDRTATLQCPKRSLAANHYRLDGSCKCASREALTTQLHELAREISRLQYLHKQVERALDDC